MSIIRKIEVFMGPLYSFHFHIYIINPFSLFLCSWTHSVPLNLTSVCLGLASGLHNAAVAVALLDIQYGIVLINSNIFYC